MSGMETRRTNKTAHPGIPDLPTPKKTRARKKNSKKTAVSEETLQQFSEELAQIEDESAADYANDKTPGAPPKKHQRKTRNTKKSPLVVKGGDDTSETQDITDTDLNEGSDIERTIRKKQKSGTELRNTVQSKRKAPQKELSDNEEPMAEGRGTTKASQQGKGVEASKGTNQKGGKKGATVRKAAAIKGKAAQKEVSDVEMRGTPSRDSTGASSTDLHLCRCPS